MPRTFSSPRDHGARRASILVAILSLSSSFALAQAPVAPAEPTMRETTANAAPSSESIAVHWVRDSAEYRALCLQAYAVATRLVDEKAKGETSGTWAVVLDGDETTIDNSQYQKEHPIYGADTWTDWTKRSAAGEVPGAKAFMAHVRELGGKVAIVTNRKAGEEAAATEANYAKLGMKYDLMLPQSGPMKLKEKRFAQVEEGKAKEGVGPLKIVMFVGDNIQDFPEMRQEALKKGDPAFADFGTRFILLPNPMYGSWEKNERR